MTYEAGAVCWDRLRRAMVREYPDAKMLRVFEMHPGGHGMHVHAVTPDWLRVNVIIRLARRCGFGRIHVVEWNKKAGLAAGEYISKYLTKQRRPEYLKGKRYYATIGIPREERTLQSDIIIQSPQTLCWAIMACHPDWESWRFGERTRIIAGILRRYVESPQREAASHPSAAGRGVRRGLYLVIVETIRQGRETIRRHLGRSPELPRDLQIKLAKSAEAREKGDASAFCGRIEPSIYDEIETERHEYETRNQPSIAEAISRGVPCPF